MPEMPEVESIVSGVKDKIVGKTITTVETMSGRDDVIKHPSPAEYAALLSGRTIVQLYRRGKYILMEVSGGLTAVFHLRMTGRFMFRPDGIVDDKYACAVYHFDDGSCLVYADVRRLGTLNLLNEDELAEFKGLCILGLEPLSKEFTVAYLRRIMQGSRTPVKTFLLNQKHIAGLGNIYVDESLGISHIHPLRRAGSLSEQEIRTLHKTINKVILSAIKDGGTTFRDYRNGMGGKGSHQQHLYIYGRKGKPCRFCGTPIEKMKISSRGTYYCPVCQKLKD